MALDKIKLKNDLINVFNINVSNTPSLRDIAIGIEKAFLNYIKDVNLKLHKPGLNPNAPPAPGAPDPSYQSKNLFKPVADLSESPQIRNGLIKSFEANLQREDPQWSDANKGFSDFLKTFVSYETVDGYKALGETKPAEIELLKIFPKNKYYESSTETATALSELLNEFVEGSVFEGKYAKIVGPITFVNPESLILPDPLPYKSKLV